MKAMIIDGKKVAARIYQNLQVDIRRLRSKRIVPGLAVILVGNDAASRTYIRMKEKKISELGLYSEEYIFKSSIPVKKLKKLILKLNRKKIIDGILVQLPLPEGFNTFEVINTIDYRKDIDGFHPYNIGLLASGNPSFVPCTPLGVLELLEFYKVKLKGKNIVIIGRSQIVGRPLSILLSLKGRDATVTLCHSRTRDIKSLTKTADIVITAMGRPGFLKSDMVKAGAVVIDVGISRIRMRDGSHKLAGDVDFKTVSKKASFITPVPGGVGPMTIAMLMKNLVFAASNFRGK